MSEILEITELGNRILREETTKVENPKDSNIQKLIDDMMLTMKEADGVGIAAPQVSENYQIFIMHSNSNPRYPDAPEMEPIAIINPEIISESDEIEIDWEGCLSIPGLRGLVPRYKSIKVRYLDRDANEVVETLEDFPARIFQHEFDHLKGILFLDRIESVDHLFTDKEYVKIVEALSEQEN